MRWLNLAWRNVWRNAGRTLIVSLIIATGALAAMVTLGFMLASFTGLQESTIRGGVGHIQITKQDDLLSGEDVANIKDWAKGDSRVRFTMGRLNFDGLISTGPRTLTLQIVGVEPELERRMSLGFAPIVAGEHLPLEYDPMEPNVILGRDLAALMGGDPGTQLTLLGTTLDGVLNAIDLNFRGSYSTGVPELDRRQGMTRLETARFLLNTELTETQVIVLRDSEDVPAVAAELRSAFPELTLQTWIDIAPFYSRVVTLYKNIFVVLGAVLSLVIGFSVVNVVVLAINERRKEMGTMIALGITRTRIRAMFAFEGGIIGAAASFVGVVLGALVAVGVTALDIQLPPPPGRSLGYPLIIYTSATAGALIVVFFTLLTAFVAWAPTGQLRKHEPIKFLAER